MLSGGRLPFQHRHRVVRVAQFPLPRHGETDDPRADDHKIVLLHI